MHKNWIDFTLNISFWHHSVASLASYLQALSFILCEHAVRVGASAAPELPIIFVRDGLTYHRRLVLIIYI